MQIHIWVMDCVLSTCVYCILNTKFNLTELDEYTFIFSFCIFFFYFFLLFLHPGLSFPSILSFQSIFPTSLLFPPLIHSSPVSFMWVSCSPSWPLTNLVAADDLEVLILLTLLPKCWNVQPSTAPGFQLKKMRS